MDRRIYFAVKHWILQSDNAKHYQTVHEHRHHSLLLMNSFNKTEAAVFLVQAMLPEGFLFHQFKSSYQNTG